MKFLLINPFTDYNIIKDIYASESEVPPLGLLYLAKVLEKEGHSVEIIDFCVEKFSKERLQKTLPSMDAVGITVRSYEIKSVFMISDLIKKTDYNIPIIVGGPHCTIQPQQALLETQADICVEGEAENIITKIADALEGEINLANIPGVYYKDKGLVKKGPPTEIIDDLDSIPFPARHLVNQYDYGTFQGVSIYKGKVTSISTSRGCPFNCRFCTNPAITKIYRLRSAENVVEEIKEIEQKYDSIQIVDENFLVNKKRANRILDLIIKEKYDIELGIWGIRIDAADEYLFKKMKKAGVKFVVFGIESGNQDVLDFYDKRITLDQIQKSVKLARDKGFITQGNFILGSPLETKKHIINTINFAKKLPLDFVQFSPLGYLKGSRLWTEAVANGKIRKDELIVLSDSTRGLGNFTEKELWGLTNKAFKDFYLRPGYILDQIFQSFIRGDFRIIREGLKLILREDNVLKYKDRHSKS